LLLLFCCCSFLAAAVAAAAVPTEKQGEATLAQLRGRQVLSRPSQI
jgi:hypothetical protein